MLGSAVSAQQFAPQPIAQGSYDTPMPMPIDLDGDGDLDFVAQANQAQTLVHFRNLGGSRCAVFATTHAPGLRPPVDLRPGVGDLDGDGAADMLLNSNSGVQFLRNVQGRLAVHSTLPGVIGGPASIRLLDADRDGDLDLLLVTSTVLLFWNDGFGNFTAAAPGVLPGNSTPGILETADLDGDGAIDLLTTIAGSLRTWMARGNAFVDESAQRLPALTGSVTQLAAADLDNDGDFDLTGIRTSAPPVAFLLRNDGTGRFTAAPTALSGLPTIARLALPIDVDSDGDRDLLVERTLLTNDGSGTFTAAGTLAFDPFREVDLDGDRWPDLVSRTGIARNDGGRGFRPLVRCSGYIPGDIDTDGDTDVIGNPGQWIMEGGTMDLRAGVSGFGDGRMVDMDRDGDLDLIGRSSEVWVAANDGSGAFRNVFLINAPSFMAGTLASFDLDDDGDLDLAWGGGSVSATPQIARNHGNLVFTSVPTTMLPAGTTFRRLLIGADLDADGFDDLLSIDVLGTSWLRNRGNGTFENASTRLAAGSGGESVRAEQLDRDPELELLIVRNPTVLLLDRVGANWVDASWRLPASATPATGAVALDFDTDGDADLAIAGGGGFLLRNDGNGVFENVTATHGPTSQFANAAFDVDADGDPDLLDGLDLWINRQRQLSVAAAAEVGGALGLEWVSEPGFGTGMATCLATLAFSRSRTGLPMLGGAALPDLASSQLLGTLVSVNGSLGTLSTPIPSNPALRALTLQMQGLVIGTRGELALANHLTVTID